MILWAILGGGFLFVAGFIVGVFCGRRSHQTRIARLAYYAAARKAAAQTAHLPRIHSDINN